MKTTKDIVLISTPQKYNDRIEISGGTVLWLDTSFRPQHHVSISGIVEAVPGLLSPSHYAHSKSTMDLQVGDKVYFNYLTIHPENLVWHNDQEYYQQNSFVYLGHPKDLLYQGLNLFLLQNLIIPLREVMDYKVI